MDLGLSAKALAWMKVFGVTLAAFQVAYNGFSSDQWVSGPEWGSLVQITALAFVGAVTGSPKDAREPQPISADRKAAIEAGAPARKTD